MPINRRLFLSLSATGAAALALPLEACAPARADEIVTVRGAYVVFDAAGRRIDLLPRQHRVTVRDPAGKLIASFGGIGLGAGRLNGPAGVAVGPDGLLYVVESGNCRVQVFDAAGATVRVFGEWGTGDAQLSSPSAIAVTAAGRVMVADSLNRRVAVFGLDGAWLGAFGSEMLTAPAGLAVTADGSVHVVDAATGLVHLFAPNGALVRSYGGRSVFTQPRAISFDGAGNCWVGDVTSSALRRFDARGNALEGTTLTADGAPVAAAHLSRSPDGRLFVSVIAAPPV